MVRIQLRTIVPPAMDTQAGLLSQSVQVRFLVGVPYSYKSRHMNFPRSLGESSIQLSRVESFLRACGEREWASKLDRKWLTGTETGLGSDRYYQLQAEITRLLNDVLNE